jgi:hypothetical protein
MPLYRHQTDKRTFGVALLHLHDQSDTWPANFAKAITTQGI